jgi:crotonobetainyl-CoA:carnitine CoA-transferase CaiB-like acyl-CoA transferase
MTADSIGGPGGLAGIRVIEVAGGVALAWAAKQFADLGADVIRIEGDQAHDVVRNRPYDVHRWLNTNKRSMTDADVATLVHEADLVLHDLRPSLATRRGVDFGELRRINPAIVVCSITAFGMTGPYAEYVGEELNIIHGSSWGFLSPSASTRLDLAPIKAPGHFASIHAALMAAVAALAAVESAATTGLGAHVDFSLIAAAAKLTETAPISASYHGVDASRVGSKIVTPWNIYRCSDGLVQFICPEVAHWEAFVEMLGRPEWTTLPSFSHAAARRENTDLVDLYIGDWMADKRVEELCRWAHEKRVCISPVNTMAQLDADQTFAERRFFATTPDLLRLPGPGARAMPDHWALRTDAPGSGEHNGESWRPRVGAIPTTSRPPTARPLEGIRVCDFTWIWAGPACTQLLAHLGADVIKLESPDHVCMFRRLNYPPTGMQLTHDTGGAFHLYNTDKRSVAIDLRNAEARELAERLIARSDIVVDNFAVGTMARLGFGPDDVRRINPSAMVVQLSGYGQTGRSAGYMAYGPVGAAVAGLSAANGYEGGDATETGIAIGDPATGIAGAWATMAALAARRRHGEVATIDVSMVEAIASTIGEPWMQYVSTGASPLPTGNSDPQWAPHGCYTSAGEDRWLTIACTSEDKWTALCRVVDPSMLDDSRFSTAVDRKVHEAALNDRIESWTRTLDRWDATQRLQAAGVAAFPSLSPLDLWSGDPHFDAIGMIERPDHRVVGRRVIPGIPWRITPGRNGIERAAPCLGEHTVEVLSDVLGCSHDEIAHLLAVGAVHGPASL